MWPFSNSDKTTQLQAQQFAPSVLEMSRECAPILAKALFGEDHAEKIEESCDPLSMEILAFILHLCDRVMFMKRGHEVRTVFMDFLLLNIRDYLAPPQDEELENLYNTRQEFYSQFQRLIAEEGESHQGTLFWEFGKALGAVYANSNPVSVLLATRVGGDLFTMVDSVLREMKLTR
jgi:hypothetical protein